ncbi:hypothetical protein Tco_1190451 [Tanacetum coccineum]
MTTLKFADTHNMVAFLSKPAESDGFEQIVDFLNAQPIRYALTVNPTIYISCIEQFWSTGVVKTINGEVQLHALVDGKKIIISEASVRRDLKLEDEEDIDYEAVHKELGECLVRAATTASSLEAEQDNGNITKTQSKATPNESSSLGTTSGGGPRCQETMGDTITQTRQRPHQSNEIASLKRMVKKLEQKKRSRTQRLKRLRKVGATARVESSRDEASLGEDAFKQGRINAIDTNDDITLVSVYNLDEEMFNMDALNGEEVFVAGQNENVVEEVVDATQVSITATTVTITTEEITLAQALEALKTSKPKGKGINDRRTCEAYEEESSKIAWHEEVALKAFKRVNTFVDFRIDLVEGSSKRAREELIQESLKKQKVDDDKEIGKLNSVIGIVFSDEKRAQRLKEQIF